MDYQSISSFMDTTSTGLYTVQATATHRWLFRALYLFYNVAEGIMLPLIAQYIRDKGAPSKHLKGLSTHNSQVGMLVNDTDILKGTSQWMEEEEMEKDWMSTQAILITTMLSIVPSVPVVLLLGIWSDASERRVPHLFVSVLGRSLYALFLLLDLYVNVDHFILLYTGALLCGVTGGTATFFAISSAYIADTANLEYRTLDMSFLEITRSLGLAVGAVVPVYWINNYGYVGPCWLILGITLIACVICLCIEEPYDTSNNLNTKPKLAELLCFSWCTAQLAGILGYYFMAYGIYTFIEVGIFTVGPLYLAMLPLCFDNIKIAWWLFSLGVVMAVGTFIVPGLCLHCLDDRSMAYIGLLSSAVGSIFFIFAKTQLIIFLGKIIILFICHVFEFFYWFPTLSYI